MSVRFRFLAGCFVLLAVLSFFTPGCSKKQEEPTFAGSRKRLGLPPLPEEASAPKQAQTAPKPPPRATNSAPAVALAAPKFPAVSPTSSNTVASSAKKVATLESPYKDELAWLEGEITQDIVEMAYYAKNKSLKGLNQPFLKIEHTKDPRTLSFPEASVEKVTLDLGGPTPETLQLTVDSLWSANPYVDFAKTVLDRLGVKGVESVTSTDETLLKALLEQPLAAIEEQNRRVSKLLETNMADADAHEAAAVITGALALREASGDFSDNRRLICRTTAHLAMAKALRDAKPLGINGRIAEAMTLVLSARSAELVKALPKLKEESGGLPVQAAWLQALNIDATLDWRVILAAPEKASFQEQFAHATALANYLSTERAAEFVAKQKPVADWCRLILQASFSVQQGHEFVPIALQLEFNELAKVWQAGHTDDIKMDELEMRLNVPPQRCVASRGDKGEATVEVIDWGTWAAHFQRHICQQVVQSERFYRDKWGVSDKAAEFQVQADKMFLNLELYPLVQRKLMEKQAKLADYQEMMKRAVPMCVKRPEMVTAANWYHLSEKIQFVKIPEELPDASAWFSMRVLPGTAYNVDWRLTTLNRLYAPDVSDLTCLKDRNPYNYYVCRTFGDTKFMHSLAEANFQEAFGAIRDYCLHSMNYEAALARFEPAEYQKVFEKICVVDPDSYFTLGKYLADHKMDVPAAEAYQKGVDLADNRVRMANNVDWLVNYYYDKGEVDKALKIAEMAAEVYSYLGLETMAKLQEKMKKYDEAEKYFVMIHERYDDQKLVFNYYQRAFRATNDPKWQQKMDAIRNAKPATP